MELTTEEYKEVLVNKLTLLQKRVLRVLYSFPNSSATAKNLALALNYNGFQAANRQIGQIGKSISEYINKLPRDYEGKKGSQPAFFEIVGKYYENIGWVMWVNLKQALEQLNEVSFGGKEFIERLSTEAEPFEENKFLKEGKLVQVLVNRYERSQKARLQCISYYGKKCSACNFDFEEVYGGIANDFIHVHHKTQLSDVGEEYEINPIEDLIPVCANCHSVIHLAKPALTIEELKKLLKKSSR